MARGWRRFLPSSLVTGAGNSPQLNGDSSALLEGMRSASPADHAARISNADTSLPLGAAVPGQISSGPSNVTGLPPLPTTPQGDSSGLRAYASLCRLARFGANLSDAHSCLIFFHGSLVSALDPAIVPPGGHPHMVLAGYHSLSPEVIPNCVVSAESGLIGWVASHGRSIHVSPFELDSRTLGIYSADQQLKSFIGIPISLQDPYDMLSAAGVGRNQLLGVLACDSKKSFAFSKIQGKLLEDLSREIAETVTLLVEQQGRAHPDVAWHLFLRRGAELARSIRISSVEVVRVVMTNFRDIEHRMGTSTALTAAEQLHRIIRQVLPPHFPSVRLLNGDVVMAFDNMMTSFYESRIRAVTAHHLAHHGMAGQPLSFEFIRASSRERRRRDVTIEELVQLTSSDDRPLAAQPVGGTRFDPTQRSNTRSTGGIVRLEKAVGYGNSRR